MTETLSRSDLQMIGQAVRHRWHIPEQLYTALPMQLAALLAKGTPREKIAAAKVLAQIHGQNEADNPIQVQHAHIHAVATSPETPIEDRRKIISDRIARLR